MDQSAPANVAFHAAFTAKEPAPSWETWHRRYGHVGYPCYDPGHLALFFLYFSLFVSPLYSPFSLFDRFPDHVIDYLTSGHLTLSPLLGFLIVHLFWHALLFPSLGRSVTPIVRDLIVVLPLLFVTPIVLLFCTLSQVAAL